MNNPEDCQKLFEQMIKPDEGSEPWVRIYNYKTKDVVINTRHTLHFIPHYACSCGFMGADYNMYCHLVEKHKLPVALVLNVLKISLPTETRTPEFGAVKS